MLRKRREQEREDQDCWKNLLFGHTYEGGWAMRGWMMSLGPGLLLFIYFLIVANTHTIKSTIFKWVVQVALSTFTLFNNQSPKFFSPCKTETLSPSNNSHISILPSNHPSPICLYESDFSRYLRSVESYSICPVLGFSWWPIESAIKYVIRLILRVSR